MLAVLLWGATSACAGDTPAGEESPEAAASPTESPTEPGALAPLDASISVLGQANIYGAGRELAPDPGDGGGGFLPPGWLLPEGTEGVVTFTISGEISPIAGRVEQHDANGNPYYETRTDSYKGISGIRHKKRQMFLVGVFLSDAPPREPAPPDLDFTTPPANDRIAPILGQVFLIGDGRSFEYEIPRGATRLFLGFADGYFGKGPPGWYGNNTGELTASVTLTED